jgi:hydrogenase small subunit
MLAPSSHPWHADETLAEHLEARGYSRRDFLGFCAKLGAVLGLSPVLQSRVVQALGARRPSVIWLQLQECTGCVESVIRTDSPTIGDLLLEILSLDYQHTLMAAAGHAAESALRQSMRENYGKYLLVVTGSIPLAEGGVYTMAAGRTAKDVLEEVAAGAAAVIAVGACAHWGSVRRRARIRPAPAASRRWCATSRWSTSPGVRPSRT